MSEVIRALEGPLAPMVCASEDPVHAAACDRTAFCTVNPLWMKVREAVAGALDSVTLADLTHPRGTAHPFHAGTSTDPVVVHAEHELAIPTP